MVRIAEGALAGALAGAIAGLGARLAMRMVALGVTDGVGQNPAFTLEGTASIVLTGAIAGAPLGVLFVAARRWLPGAPRTHGVVFGFVVLLLLGPLFFIGAADEFLSRGRVALFAALFPIFGLAVGLAVVPSHALSQRLPPAGRVVPALLAAAGGLLVVFGIAGLATSVIGTHGLNAVPLFVPWLALAVLVWRARNDTLRAGAAAR